MTDDDLYPKNNKEYSTKVYWDWRYTKDQGDYDWFQGCYDAAKKLVVTYIRPGDSVLQLGCGNSKFSEDIYDHFNGNVDITNNDFSDVVIASMKSKTATKKMKWDVMDIMDMTYADASFDIILDKGTMDAIMCEQGDQWTVPDEIAERCHKELSHVSRILRPGGLFIYITFGQPHFRRPLLLKDEYQWNLELKTIGDFFHYYVYILTKKL